MGAADLVLRGRAAAEALMVDECRVARSSGEVVTDPDTGVDSPASAVVYPTAAHIASGNNGRCKVQSATAQAASPEAGGHAFTVEQLRLDFPVSSSLRTGDVATITASEMDPDLVGLAFRLVELARGTFRTADRWNVELVTG